MNNFDAISYLNSRDVKYRTSGKNIGNGDWVGISECVFCGKDNFHLAVNKSGAVNCWICGKHSIQDFIAKIENCNWRKAKEIQTQFKLDPEFLDSEEEVEYVPVTSYSLPTQFSPVLPDIAKEYLKSRRFDPLELRKKYDAHYSGDYGKYKYRLIFPIRETANGPIVSFVGKDITGKQAVPYLYCEDDLAVVKRRELIFNLDRCQSDSVILTEGIFDAIRVDGIALLSVQFTKAQLLKLKRYKNFYIMFDNDDAGKRMAGKLEGYLTWAENIQYVEYDAHDPAELDYSAARELKRIIF